MYAIFFCEHDYLLLKNFNLMMEGRVLFDEFLESLAELVADCSTILLSPGVWVATAEGSVILAVIEASNREVEGLAVLGDLDGVGTIRLRKKVVKVITAIRVVHNPGWDGVVEGKNELLSLSRDTAGDAVDCLLTTSNVLGTAHLRSDPNVKDGGALEDLLAEHGIAVLIAMRSGKREAGVIGTTTRELDEDGLALKGVGDLSELTIHELASRVLDSLLETPEDPSGEVAEATTDADLIAGAVDTLKEPAGGALDLGLLGVDNKVVVILVDEDHEGAPLVLRDEATIGKLVEHARHAKLDEVVIDIAHELHIRIVIQLDLITKVGGGGQILLNTKKLTDLTLATSRESVKKHSLDHRHYNSLTTTS